MCVCVCVFFLFFFFFCFFVVVVVVVVDNMTVFRVSIALPFIPITPMSIDTFLKVLGLLPQFRKLVRHSGVQVCIATTANV